MSTNTDEWASHSLLNRYTDAVNQRDWETYRALLDGGCCVEIARTHQRLKNGH